MGWKEVVPVVYIQPINSYQYQQYQERMNGVKTNYNRTPEIEKVKRVYLSQTELFNKEKYLSDQKQPQRPSGNTAEKIYAALTGIGRYLNESI